MRKGFAKKVDTFLSSVTFPDEQTKNEFAREIARLVMQIQTGQGSTTLRRIAFRLNIQDELKFFKDQYLDSSAYVHRCLWKATLLAVAGEKYQQLADKTDVEYILGLCTPEDIKKIKKASVNETCNIESIDLMSLTTGKNKKRDFLSHVRLKRNPLTFIPDNDPGHDLEDMEQDLLAEAVRVYNMYGRSKGKNMDLCGKDTLSTRFQKYLETALNNKVNNLKEYHTCDSRRRVVSTRDADYKRYKKLKKMAKEHPENTAIVMELEAIRRSIDTTNTEYYSTVNSLVASDDGELKVIDVVDNTEHQQPVKMDDNGQLMPQMSSENAMWVNKMCDRVDTKIATFLKIVVGERNSEFEVWATRNGIDVDNFDNLVRGARTFCKVTRHELATNEVLEEIREDLCL